MKEILSSITDYAGFVDANALTLLWPIEFARFRICLISGPTAKPIFSIFHLKTTKEEDLEDIYIRCDGSHFTLLRPYTSPLVRSRFLVVS